MTDPRALLDTYAASDADPWESGEETVDQQAPAAFTALRAVLDLHTEFTAYEDTLSYCRTCNDGECNPVPWPCPTVQAITTALEAK